MAGTALAATSNTYVGQRMPFELPLIENDLRQKPMHIVYYLEDVYSSVILKDVVKRNNIREREFGNLLKIEDNFPKFVVSMDEVDMSQKGIVHLNIKDFLLREWE